MVKRLFWLVLGALIGFILSRRRSRPPAGEAPVDAADPAEELRRKLDEARERETPPRADDVDARRGEVHDRGRSALDEMRRTTSE